jgi:uncharacterized membrane protein
MAAGGSLALLGFGVWFRERGGRVEAALAAAAAGVAALFTTVTVAAQVYELIPTPVGIGLATVVAAMATVLAVRWRSPIIASLGILGALLAPVLTDAPTSAGTVAFVFVALASAAGVLLWQRWTWLGPAAFVISAPQWIVWAVDDASTTGALIALVAFGLLNAALAVGFELRVPREQLKPSSAFLLVLGALALALTGWFAFATDGDEAVAKAWLLGLAAAHIAIGLAAGRLGRVTRDLRLLVLVLGVVLGDVAFAALADGPVLSIGWTLGSVALAALAGLPRLRSMDATVAGAGLGAHLCLALLHAVVVDAPPESVSGATDTLTAIATLSAIAARLLRLRSPCGRGARGVAGRARRPRAPRPRLSGADHPRSRRAGRRVGTRGRCARRDRPPLARRRRIGRSAPAPRRRDHRRARQARPAGRPDLRRRRRPPRRRARPRARRLRGRAVRGPAAG